MRISFGTLTCARVGFVEAFGQILDGARNSGLMEKHGRFVGMLYATEWVFVKWHELFDSSRRRRLFAIHLWKLPFLCFLSLDAWMSIRAMLVRLPKPGSGLYLQTTR